MSWRIDGAIAEAEAQIAMLEAAGLADAARLSRARRDGLRDAKVFAEQDWADAAEEVEAEATEAAEAEPEDPPPPARGRGASTFSEAERARRSDQARAQNEERRTQRRKEGVAWGSVTRARLTPAREAFFRKAWADPALSGRDIWQGFNAIDPETPGLPHPPGIYQIAKHLGLPTQRVFAPAPAAAEPPDWRTDPLGTMTAEERRDAEDIILVQRRGAREMAADLDWPLDRCQAIAEALRTTKRQATAA